MPVMLSKTYAALRSAQGVTDEQARDAAEEIAAYEQRLAGIESTLKLHSLMLSVNSAMLVAILVRVFFTR